MQNADNKAQPDAHEGDIKKNTVDRDQIPSTSQGTDELSEEIQPEPQEDTDNANTEGIP